MVVYLLFSRHISCAYFWHASIAIDFRRGRAQSTVQSIALHIVCVVSRVSKSGSCYIYRLFTLDKMQEIGVWEWVVI